MNLLSMVKDNYKLYKQYKIRKNRCKDRVYNATSPYYYFQQNSNL